MDFDIGKSFQIFFILQTPECVIIVESLAPQTQSTAHAVPVTLSLLLHHSQWLVLFSHVNIEIEFELVRVFWLLKQIQNPGFTFEPLRNIHELLVRLDGKWFNSETCSVGVHNARQLFYGQVISHSCEWIILVKALTTLQNVGRD